MRPVRVAVAVAVAFVFAAVSGCKQGKPDPGSLSVVGDVSHDFGEMRTGQSGSHSWDFVNRGRHDLTLKVGQVPCGCTSVTVAGSKDAVVRPGARAEVKVDWRLGPAVPEDWTQTVTLTSDDPATPEVGLTVHGKVSRSVVAWPGWGCGFPRYPAAESRAFSVVVFSPVDPDFRIGGAVPSSEKVAVTYRESNAEERRKGNVPDGHRAYTVSIDVPGGSFRGLYHESALMKTNVPDLPELKLGVSGQTF